MQTVNDLPAEQETPGLDGIQVQRIVVAGKLCKSYLIVRCEYALDHDSIG